VQRDRLVRFGMPVVWVAFTIALFAASGIPSSHGALFPWIVAGMAAFTASDLRYRLPRLVRDWAPFVLVLLAYDVLRGFADGLMFHAHELPQLRVEAWIFGKPVPTVWLHEHLWHGSHDLRWWDYASTAVYMTHFLGTTVVAAALWTWRHDRFGRFATMVCGLAAAGYATYVLYPAAPPWMAAQQGNLGPATRVVPIVWSTIPISSMNHMFASGLDYANNVAAMPSLHSGYAMLLTLYLWQFTPRWLKPLLALYPFAMAFALVYGGEHYVVDIFAGWAYATVVFVVVNRVFDRREARVPARAARQQVERAEPAPVD
jgi:membrane-associated phospholipid phosphatase